MRVADYIFKTLADHGAKDVFLVTGGGAMHLDDALGREKRLHYICNLHEQACAIAAEGYARISGRPGIVCVTSGPGGTNAVTGVMGAWVDSIPMIVISGQVKRETTIAACPELKLRQLGDQEINIVDIVRPITKYAVSVRDPEQIGEILEHAEHECQSGRPGPVWIDVPLDVQAAEIPDETAFPHRDPVEDAPPPPDGSVEKIMAALKRARRPVIVAGNGVTLAGQRKTFRRLTERWRIPVLTAISGVDLLPTESPCFFGRPGILGARAANFILQNADLMLVLGTRMSLRVIGFDYRTTARAAYKIMVDADPAELAKPTFRPDLPVQADLRTFLPALLEATPDSFERPEWLAWCARRRKRYPADEAAESARKGFVSSYEFPFELAAACREDDIIMTGNGTAYTSTFQTMPLKKKNRMFGNVGCAAMGYDLPAAIGAAVAGDGRRVLCITGDGSIQMNLQELQTILNYRLPIKIFMYDNNGYLSIRLTQNAFFDGNFVGSGPSSGVVLPDMIALARAYGLSTTRISSRAELRKRLPEILKDDKPEFVRIVTDPDERLFPKAASKRKTDGSMISAPLEDLHPFLGREEFRDNMIVDPLKEDF